MVLTEHLLKEASLYASEKLPDDFQTAEYLLKYGQVDIVSKRKNLRKTLANILDMHGY